MNSKYGQPSKHSLKRYGLRHDYPKWQQLMAIKQKENESVSAYGQRFTPEAVDKQPRMKDEGDEYVFTFKLVDGLLSSIASSITALP